MNKRDKALIKLLGMLAGQLVIIATNLAFINTDKNYIGARKMNRINDIGRAMLSNMEKIKEIVEEATNEQA